MQTFFHFVPKRETSTIARPVTGEIFEILNLALKSCFVSNVAHEIFGFCGGQKMIIFHDFFQKLARGSREQLARAARGSSSRKQLVRTARESSSREQSARAARESSSREQLAKINMEMKTKMKIEMKTKMEMTMKMKMKTKMGTNKKNALRGQKEGNT